MKKYLFSLVVALIATQFISAQDLNALMQDMSKVEGVQHQVVDRAMLDMSIKAALETDSTGELKSNMPAFMEKLDSVVVVAIENYSPEVKTRFESELQNFKDGNGYTTLLTVKDGSDNVRIISYKEGDRPKGVFILVLDEEDAVVVKMSGELDESDLEEIIKEQGKNK
ncbi:DUF4252 domain-containing protein [Dysgonomonas sp. 521]|uniref:DUF4252 domain-containing protein n=1 Tax=Dysgonomonas sp. 521 TaxID=2302932 RepID=UPI0013D57D7D|nr:DUF4252 domain-containing protein [Dysgonomonas sp. 521]NDV93731.1 DUF4252 domain-containing protein [Dysgonomonas sp. 521]